MENNFDTPDFGIEETITAGQGNANLLKDLISPETSTSNPDDIKPNTDDSNTDDNDDKKSKADSTTEDEKAEKGPNALTSFLIDEDEEEEEEEEEDKKPVDKKIEKEKTSDKDEEEDDEGIISFNALANELASLGVFNKLEDEETIDVKTPEEFLERFKAEKTIAANQMVTDFIGQFGQSYQDAFQAIYVKGVDPKTYFSTQNKIEDFVDMDLSKESNQEHVVKEMLKSQGFDGDDIDTEVEKLKNYGDLEETSKRYHKVLVKKESSALEAKIHATEQEQTRKAAIKQEYVSNVSQVLADKLKEKSFDGIPLTPKTANELQDFLLVDKWKTESGELLTDFDREILELKRPENHANKVKIALLLKLLENDPTLSTIQKRGVSKSTSTLFKEVARQKTVDKRTSIGNSNNQPANSWFK